MTTNTEGVTMTERALGTGAVCCGKDCDLCSTPSPAAPVPAPEPEAVEDDFELSEEEDDE